jgi:hypothetical protein
LCAVGRRRLPRVSRTPQPGLHGPTLPAHTPCRSVKPADPCCRAAGVFRPSSARASTWTWAPPPATAPRPNSPAATAASEAGRCAHPPTRPPSAQPCSHAPCHGYPPQGPCRRSRTPPGCVARAPAAAAAPARPSLTTLPPRPARPPARSLAPRRQGPSPLRAGALLARVERAQPAAAPEPPHGASGAPGLSGPPGQTETPGEAAAVPVAAAEAAAEAAAAASGPPPAGQAAAAGSRGEKPSAAPGNASERRGGRAWSRAGGGPSRPAGFPVWCPLGGQLLETNERLREQPRLLYDRRG